MATKIKLKRNTLVNIGTLDAGEPYFATDTFDLYLGSSAGNKQIGSVGTLDSRYLKLSGGTMTGQLISTLAVGTAPLAVTSTTLNTNLNADLLDGNHAVAFSLTGHTHDTYLKLDCSNSMGATTLITNLNADLWDGYQFSDYLNQSVKTNATATFASVISTGDFYASCDGSSTTTPRVFGFKDLSSGEAIRVQFGDEHNGFQNGYALDTTIYSYWGIVLCGGMQNYSSGFLPPAFTQTTNTGVLILSTNDIGDDPGAGATNIVTLGIQAVSGQTNNLTEWRNSSAGVLASVSSLGAVNSAIAQTTVNGLTGTAVWSMPFQGGSYKKFLVYLTGFTSAGTVITFPTAFVKAPMLSGDQMTIAVATTTTVTLTSVGAVNGWVFCEGY
jgi:hypothetical protein